jgi:DNA-binding winged helix-turn-helix (wHTH) protein
MIADRSRMNDAAGGAGACNGAATAKEILTLGRFQLDLRRRALMRDRQLVRIGGRALDILCVLASAQGALVTKEELMAQVWSGEVVGESNLQVQVSALRKVLHEEESAGNCIVTVPGRGYRLLLWSKSGGC